jgi:MoaA/NifB/PqqE/SkfB family radical SAM enzyme
MRLPHPPAPISAVTKDARFVWGVLRRRPFNCLVQVTNRCNMKCSFCDFWPNPASKQQELTVDEYERLGRELAELGTFLISIEGGEPFVRRDLLEIVRVLSRHHVTTLFTNGWYVTDDNARALFDAGLTHASVSIDYPDAGRHDAKRCLTGTTDRAWAAVDSLRQVAPRGGKQVHVMTVLMGDNHDAMPELFEQSARREVGHQVTLLSVAGFRRGRGHDALPPAGAGRALAALWDRYPHVRFFRSYFEQIDAFLEGAPMPTCRAGLQGFNIDHVGNVSPCIERIDESVGNVRESSLRELHQRLCAREEEIARCNQCWTACRGFQQALGSGGALRDLVHLGARTRSY